MTKPAAAGTHGLIGRSPQIQAVRRLIEKASRNRLPVLLLGESGTGKEVVSRAIYNAQPRGNFVPIDCGSLVGTLMESELFGHVKGSFSGASGNKKGLVELADGGTAFFDEIGDLPLEMQVKLLRLIQECEYRPVGALQWRKVDLRIIAATHRELKAEVAAGRFRNDLFFRLEVFVIHLAPLRDRKEDIPLLIDYFLEQCAAAGLPPFRPGDDVLQALQSYDWPGNVRELKHYIERMAAMHSEGALQSYELPTGLQNHVAGSSLHQLSNAVDDWRDRECVLRSPSPVIPAPQCLKNEIVKALAATHGERGRAAKMLRIGRTTLYRKIKEFGLE